MLLTISFQAHAAQQIHPSSGTWIVLYSGGVDISAKSKSRIFSPPLQPIEEPVTKFMLDIDRGLKKDLVADDNCPEFTSGITSKSVLQALATVSDVTHPFSCLISLSLEDNLTNLSVSPLPLEQ